MTSYTVDEQDVGKRLDVFIIDNVPQLSRSYVKTLIEDGKITINNSSVKASERVKLGQTVSLDFELEQLSRIPKIEMPIIYEDDDSLVVNKPVGVLSHSKGSFNPEATVATFIRPKLKDLDGERGGIVHRLDRATSGVMITAKNPQSMRWLQKQFSGRKTKKTYVAIVTGVLDPPAAVIDMPIERNPKKPQSFRVGPGGKPATTYYQTLKVSGQYSLLEMRPETGRTHQLRVHLSYLGHPIVGDTLYNGEPAERLYLHAKSLELTLPNRVRRVFNVPMPATFTNFLKSEGA